MNNISIKQLYRDPRLCLAFGLGAGLSPKMPGTVGTLVAIPFYLLFAHFSYPFFLGIVILSFIFGIYICDDAEKKCGVTDHGGIVFDEWVGFWLVCLVIPYQWPWIIAAFVLFRFFDILKPWPIRQIEKKLNGGLGIMVDDVLAAIMAAIILIAATWIIN